ncbi:putative Lipoyltransferase [Halenospora varia]|nr:putative Lipoyltransferase [Halenospora varia]
MSTTLKHIHLPGTTPFSAAQALQSLLVTQHLKYKASPSTTPEPPPYLLTFSPTPVYTFGRRSPPSLLPPSTLSTLREPLVTRSKDGGREKVEEAELVATSRGGLTTFHGPGQLVVYPIIDLKSIRTPRFPQGLGVRDYVCALEKTTMSLLSMYKIPSFTTSNPGVWVNPREGGKTGEKEEKIAALGVHLRRHVSSFGLGLNIFTDLRWFERIVACGIEGRGVTSLVKVQGDMGNEDKRMLENRGKEIAMMSAAGQWGETFAERLWGEEAWVDWVCLEELGKELEEEIGREDEWFESLKRAQGLNLEDVD